MIDLSTGVIADIIGGAHPENPVLQILSMKQIPSGAQERYRLLVSDGKWTSSFAMLATQLNGKVASGEIANHCVVELSRYVCNTVQNNKKVLIILDLTLKKSADEVGGKIGEPTMFDPNKQQQPAPTPAPRPTPTPAARNPLAQRSVPNATASPARTPSGGHVHPIASLTPYQNKWTICARVTHKSDLRTWSNSRGEGKLFSMDLLDESGEIRATAFNEQVDKYMDLMEVNKVYYISMATLKTANKQYSNLNNDYEMTFNKMTEVIPCQENSAIPEMQFNFVALDQLESLEKDTILDVIGVCKEYSDVNTITAKSTGRELRKRDVQIVDSTKREVRLTFWGKQADEFDGSSFPVIAIKGAKLSEFNGRSLSTLGSSTVRIDPDIQEAHKLKGWYNNGGNAEETVNLSNQRSGGVGGGIGTNFKTLEEAKKENLGCGDQADYYSCTGLIAVARKEYSLYPSCPSDNCNKKVVDQGNGMYRCEKCNQTYTNFNWRLMLQANICDFSHNAWVTFFHEQAELVLGKPASEIGSLKEADPDEYENVYKTCQFKPFNFKLRVKMETYNDESRLKSSVVNVSPVNPRDESKRLIAEIKKLSGQA